MGLEVLHRQLLEHYTWSKSFEGICRDYHVCSSRLREIRIRCRQLEKEASEIREENETLSAALDEARVNAVESNVVEEIKCKLSNIQDEMLQVYKDKEKIHAEKAVVEEQLEVVRDTCSKQIEEIQSMGEKESELLETIASLKYDLKNLKEAHQLSTRELRVW